MSRNQSCTTMCIDIAVARSKMNMSPTTGRRKVKAIGSNIVIRSGRPMRRANGPQATNRRRCCSTRAVNAESGGDIIHSQRGGGQR